MVQLILQGALLKYSLLSDLHRLCCAAWETALEYQWMCVFVFSLSLFCISRVPFLNSPLCSLHLHPSIFPSFDHRSAFTSTCFCPLLFLFFLHCLFPALPLLLLESRAVSSGGSELCSHLSHQWGEEPYFIDAAPSPLFLSLFLPFLSHCLRPFAFWPPHNCCPSSSQDPVFVLFPT